MTFLRNFGTLGLILLASLAALDVYLVAQIFSRQAGGDSRAADASAREYFLDVGAGESEFVVLPGNVRVLIDAGPAGAATKALAAAIPSRIHYIDLAIVSYPSPDHFGSLADILDQYKIGAFLWSGRMPDGAAAGDWRALLGKLREKHVQIVTVGADDRILAAGSEIDILSPDKAFLASADPTEASIVALVRATGDAAGMRTLFMGAAGMPVEQYLMARGMDLRADILKVAAHGAQYAAGAAFLRAVRPAVAVIEAGGKTAASQPAKGTLARLASSTAARVLRTDLDGTIAMWIGEGGALEVATAQ